MITLLHYKRTRMHANYTLALFALLSVLAGSTRWSERGCEHQHSVHEASQGMLVMRSNLTSLHTFGVMTMCFCSGIAMMFLSLSFSHIHTHTHIHTHVNTQAVFFSSWKKEALMALSGWLARGVQVINASVCVCDMALSGTRRADTSICG